MAVDEHRFSADGRWWWDGRAWVPVRRRTTWPWVVAAILVAPVGLVALAICATVVSRPHGQLQAGVSAGAAPAAAPGVPAAACSPQPCTSDGTGWSVSASSVRYDAGSAQPWDHAEPGNVLVTVDVTFANRGAGERHADPFNFVLQDGGGVKHAVRWTTFCPLWAGVNVTAGSTYGPKCLAFEAVAGRPRPLTLVWTPALFGRDYPVQLA